MSDRVKPFLVLQLRPETEASDNEFEAILEKGGLQASQTRRVRLEQEALPFDLELGDYAGVIVGGGPGCVSDPPEAKTGIEQRIEDQVMSLMPVIADRDIPFLGCCYGIGILAHHLGASVSKQRFGEPVGTSLCSRTEESAGDALLDGLPETFLAYVGHKEAVQELPEGCTHLLRSQACPYQMIRYGENVYATQFHPEADGDVFELRVRIYRDKGYFDPEDADRIIEHCHSEKADLPARILRNFVKRYG